MCQKSIVFASIFQAKNSLFAVASVKVVKAKKWNSQGRRACDARTRKPPLVYDALKIPETKSLAVTLVRNFTDC